MFEQVKEIFLKYTANNIEITKESELVADLGLTSFDMVSIIMDFEDAFHIEISDRVLSSFVSVNDILGYLKDHD